MKWNWRKSRIIFPRENEHLVFLIFMVFSTFKAHLLIFKANLPSIAFIACIFLL